jgi:hypothetical protein
MKYILSFLNKSFKIGRFLLFRILFIPAWQNVYGDVTLEDLRTRLLEQEPLLQQEVDL